MARILLVEDEIVIVFGATMILEDAGHTVLVACDGADGLEKAEASAPDLILTDYMMPRMDGLSMISALREKGATTPVILATAISEANLPKSSQPLYDAYLRKPYWDETLVKTVHRLLGEGPRSE